MSIFDQQVTPMEEFETLARAVWDSECLKLLAEDLKIEFKFSREFFLTIYPIVKRDRIAMERKVDVYLMTILETWISYVILHKITVFDERELFILQFAGILENILLEGKQFK